MSFKVVTGDIFESHADMIVNPVNCVGVMGGGLAKAFADKFGESYLRNYKKSCQLKSLRAGKSVSLYKTKDVIICNFATKDHYKNPSEYDYISGGLIDLANKLQTIEDLNLSFKVDSIAMPALGCGLGTLDLKKVQPMIENFAQMVNKIKPIQVTLYLK